MVSEVMFVSILVLSVAHMLQASQSSFKYPKNRNSDIMDLPNGYQLLWKEETEEY